MPMVHTIIGHSNRADMVFMRGVLLAILAVFRDLIFAVCDFEHLVNFGSALFASVLI